MVKIRNNGPRVFMQNGHWLERGEEVTLPADQARLLLMINPNIEKIDGQNKKKHK